MTAPDRSSLLSERPAVDGLVLLAAMATLFVWRLEILDSPPYWDAAMGLFVEADYLVESRFDYRSLFLEEKRFTEGGRAVYLSSVLPSLLAVSFCILPTVRDVLLLWHGLELAAAAGVFVLMQLILAPRIGRLGALLVAALVCTTPLFSAQIDLIGMDLPMTFVVLFSIHLADRGRWVGAAAVALLGFFVKQSAMPLIASLLLLSGARWLGAFRRGRLSTARPLLPGVLAALVALFFAQWTNTIVSNLPTAERDALAPDVANGLASLQKLLVWSPDVVWLSGAAVAAFLVASLWNVLARRRHSSEPFEDWLARETPVILAASTIVLTGTAMAFLYVIPRYLTVIVPLAWLILGRIVLASRTARPATTAAAVVLIGVNLANQFGEWYPTLDPAGADARTGAILERSREYLLDHRSNLKAVASIGATPDSLPVLCGAPFVHFLSLPRLGYVSAPHRGYSVNTFTTPTFPFALQILADRPPSVLAVVVHNRFTDVAGARIPPAGPQGLLYDDQQPSPLRVHRIDWSTGAARPSPDVIEKALWPERAAVAEARREFEAGRYEVAQARAKAVLRDRPHDGGALLVLAEIAEARNDFESAQRWLGALLAAYPDDLAGRLAMARILIASGDRAGAFRQAELARQSHPESAAPRRALGALYATTGDLAAAESQWRKALAGGDQESLVLLSLLLIQTHRGEEAQRILEDHIQLGGADPAAHRLLAQILVQHGDYAEGKAVLERAAAGESADARTLNDLAWLLATCPDARFRDGNRALALAEAALRLRGANDPNALDTLAAAQAEGGRFEAAEQTAQRAATLAKEKGDARLSERIAARRELYRARRPYRGAAPAP